MKIGEGSTAQKIFIEEFPVQIEHFEQRMKDYCYSLIDWINKLQQNISGFPDPEIYFKSKNPAEVQYGFNIEDQAIERSEWIFEILPRTALYGFITTLQSSFESIIPEFGIILDYNFNNMFEKRTNIFDGIKEVFKNAGISLDLGKNSNWNRISDFKKIRNFIVHLNGNLQVLERIVDSKDDKGKNKFGKMTHVYNYIKNKSKYFDVSGDYLIIKTDKENNYFLYSIESFTKVLSYLFKQISNKYNPEKSQP